MILLEYGVEIIYGHTVFLSHFFNADFFHIILFNVRNKVGNGVVINGRTVSHKSNVLRFTFVYDITNKLVA